LLSHIDSIVLGLLLTAFFGLLWRRFDKMVGKEEFSQLDRRVGRIEDTLTVISADLRQFYSVTGELKGRLDTLEKRR
jgi:hypothetical protein